MENKNYEFGDVICKLTIDMKSVDKSNYESKVCYYSNDPKAVQVNANADSQEKDTCIGFDEDTGKFVFENVKEAYSYIIPIKEPDVVPFDLSDTETVKKLFNSILVAKNGKAFIKPSEITFITDSWHLKINNSAHVPASYLLENYTFLDGSPCGIVKNSEKNVQLELALDEPIKELTERQKYLMSLRFPQILKECIVEKYKSIDSATKEKFQKALGYKGQGNSSVTSWLNGTGVPEEDTVYKMTRFLPDFDIPNILVDKANKLRAIHSEIRAERKKADLDYNISKECIEKYFIEHPNAGI